MLAYISTIIPYSSPHSTTLLLPSLPPDYTTDNEIVQHFRDDKNMLLHLLHCPGYFDISYVEFDLLFSIMSTNNISVDRCRQIADDVITMCDISNAGDYEHTYHILYHVYKLTKDVRYGNSIVDTWNTHIVGDPIQEVDVDGLERCIDEQRVKETLFLYSYLSFENKVLLSNRVQLESLLYSTKVLAAMLPYYPDDPNYRIAYAIVHHKLLDAEAVEISPAEYFISRVFMNTTGVPFNDNEFGFDDVLCEHLTEDNMSILRDIMDQVEFESRIYSIGESNAIRIGGYY